ncbi:hypothetical protein [Marinobacter sp.]|uniref:hypothetical protein n=1 Tax=Marinobacter sp. TaxID=50741 RepID=UPI0035C771CD
MSKSISIQDFVGKNDIRVWMQEPIQIAGRLAATDGKSIFWSNLECDLPDPETTHIQRFEDFLDIASAAEFRPMPKLEFPDMTDCFRCGGSGKHSLKDCPECRGFGTAEAETDYNTYEVECRTCSGEGKVDCDNAGKDCELCGGSGKRWAEADRMKVDGIPCDMNPGLMSRIAHVPNIEIAAINVSNSPGLAFRCADGIGIILGMRAPREADA